MKIDAPTPSDARGRLLHGHDAVPTSSLRRLWRTGRSALGVGSAIARTRRGDPPSAEELEAIVAQLGGLKGVAMKVGQMLGYVDATVPESVRSMLALLQTAAPSAPWHEVEATVRASLGERADALLSRLEREPIAVASIGQVHRGQLPDGRAVVVKVRHRDIEAALRADFRSATLGKAFAAVSGAATVGELIDEARTAFLEECDFTLEARRQQQFAALFADDPDLVVPAVVPEFCGAAVLVSVRVDGTDLTRWLAAAPDQAARDRAGTALFRFWMRTLYREGLFHADPHPGNFAFLGDGRIVLYDFGCVRSFEPSLRSGFAELALAVRRDDVDAMSVALEALGGRAPTDARGRSELRRLLHGFFGPLRDEGARSIALDEGTDARALMRDKLAIGRLQLPGRLLFLFRLRFGLYAVLAQIGSRVDWGALERSWAASIASA
ncbi:MAG: AarF/UbiB family protein [Nannocystaceae bacterium]